MLNFTIAFTSLPLGCFFDIIADAAQLLPGGSQVEFADVSRDGIIMGWRYVRKKINKKILPSRFIKRNNLKRSDSELKAARFIRQMMDSSIRSSAFHHSITSWGFVGVLDHHGTGWEKKEQADLQHPCCGRTQVETLLTCTLEQPETKLLNHQTKSNLGSKKGGLNRTFFFFYR